MVKYSIMSKDFQISNSKVHAKITWLQYSYKHRFKTVDMYEKNSQV